MNLTCYEFDSLWESITQIEAQQVLIQLQIESWPHMKQQARDKWHRKLNQQAYPSQWDQSKGLDLSSLAAKMGLAKEG
jgi:hypothetical protein